MWFRMLASLRPVVGCTLVCVALAGLVGCFANSAPEIRTYNMGDRIDLGHFVYTVYETRWLTQIGNGPAARVPQHRFFLIRMNVGNSGAAQSIIPNMSLEDDSGHSYPEVSNGEGLSDWLGFLRPVSVAESAAGNAVFDAPPAHYKLRIFDEENQRAALVDLPLSFRSETPEVEVPGEQK
jgi:hypothetical protein